MGNPKVKTPPQLGLVSFPFNLGEDEVHVLLSPQGRKCRPKRQRHKGRRAAALYPTLLYTLSKSTRTHGQWDGRRVTDLSPSALRCHRRGLEHKIRYETGWWLGYLTISGLGTLTALQITSNFAGDCTVRVVAPTPWRLHSFSSITREVRCCEMSCNHLSTQ